MKEKELMEQYKNYKGIDYNKNNNNDNNNNANNNNENSTTTEGLDNITPIPDGSTPTPYSSSSNLKSQLSKYKNARNPYEDFITLIQSTGLRDRIEQKLNMMLQLVFIKSDNSTLSSEISKSKDIFRKKKDVFL